MKLAVSQSCTTARSIDFGPAMHVRAQMLVGVLRGFGYIVFFFASLLRCAINSLRSSSIEKMATPTKGAARDGLYIPSFRDRRTASVVACRKVLVALLESLFSRAQNDGSSKKFGFTGGIGIGM